jgi:tRNA(fMet)-specific endonuclease VapC
MPATGYLLDINILVQILRGNALGQYIDNQFGIRSSLAACVISVVTVGEMFSLARYFKWGAPRINSLEGLLNRVPWIDINDRAIFQAYGEIDHYSVSHGISIGKNDAWIAATAHVTNMTLLTTDKDFDHLNPLFLKHIWIDPIRRPSQ